MALLKMIRAFLFALVLSRSIEFSSCQVVKGKISCLDCKSNLSGNKVAVKCDKVKKLVMATTEDDGSFEADLPTKTTNNSPTPFNCLAKLIGGPIQLYALNKNMVSTIVQTHDSNSYTISNPLLFSKSCSSIQKNEAKCKAMEGLTSSKAVGLPDFPPEWGLAPSSDYLPVLPIIGIP